MKHLFLCLLGTCCLSALAGQTWVRQNPFPKLVQLLDIDLDGPFGLAVGEESTCFTTTDKGITWRPRTLPQEGNRYAAAKVIPGTNGQVLLAGGTNLLASHDGGVSWTVALGGADNIYRVQVLADGTILALGSNSGFYSEDHGSTWEAIPMPDSDVSAGHFIDHLHGWVESGSFNQAQVWVTEDGGANWTVRDTLRHPVISGIHMLDASNGYLSARDFVYRTADGGHHWQRLHDTPVYSIQDLSVVSADTVWTCELNGFIFYTLDGGVTCHEIDPGIISSNNGKGIFATASGDVWMTGKFVSILHSPDNGQSWSDQVPNAKSIMYRPHFTDTEHGLVGGSAGTILWTDNGGAAWTRIQLDPDENFFGVMMLDPQRAVAGSSSGNLFVTANGGANWTRIGENLGQITDLHAFNPLNGLVVDESGRILRTSDGGQQWDIVYAEVGDLLTAVHFPDNQHGWTCGWFGRILHSDDAGLSWTPQTTGTNVPFSDIHFTSLADGWAVASSLSDSIWHTTDGGAHWDRRKLPYSTFWQGVSFSSPDTGWIAGGSAGSGLILRTNDGGQTWTPDHQSPEALFGIHAVPGTETAWCTGIGGNIVKFSPCTFEPGVTLLEGPGQPCQGDTVTYEITFNDVDEFLWSFPPDWLVVGNSNTSEVRVIAGADAGLVQVQGRDACGNESQILSLSVTTIPVPPAHLTIDGAFLQCDLVGTGYQWLLDGIELPGINGPSHAPGTSGTYSVIVTLSTGCQARTNAIDFIVTGIDDIATGPIRVFPNPADDHITIVGPWARNPETLLRYTLLDGLGHSHRMGRIGAGDEVPLRDLPNGLYWLRLLPENGAAITRLVTILHR